MVFLPAAALSILPLSFLAIGLYAAGAKLGWWVGDGTINDGEETWATAIGAILCVLMAALTYAVSYLVARGDKQTIRRMWSLGAGVVLGALGCIVLVRWLV